MKLLLDSKCIILAVPLISWRKLGIHNPQRFDFKTLISYITVTYLCKTLPKYVLFMVLDLLFIPFVGNVSATGITEPVQHNAFIWHPINGQCFDKIMEVSRVQSLSAQRPLAVVQLSKSYRLCPLPAHALLLNRYHLILYNAIVVR